MYFIEWKPESMQMDRRLGIEPPDYEVISDGYPTREAAERDIKLMQRGGTKLERERRAIWGERYRVRFIASL